MSTTAIEPIVRVQTKRVSPLRLAEAGVLGAWAGALWFIVLSGRSAFFLSSRTDWVIPAGAVLLTVATIGRLWTLRTEDPEPLRRTEAAILALFLIPTALIVILPPQSLSAFAVSRRPAFASGVSGPGTEIGAGDGTLTMLQVAGAQNTRVGLDELAAHAGDHVSYLGFVTRTPSTPADEFALNRFVISCCAAVPPGTFKIDQWMQVTGTIYPIGRNVILQADKVVAVPKPSQPYLTP